MRNIFVLLAGMVLLAACQTEDNDYYNGGRGYHGNDGRYYGRDDDRYGYDRYGYGSYYPYGQRNYPRDRIFLVDDYHRCTKGRIYQGYCYHYDDDYRRAVEWDRVHGYDNNWHKRRKEWCNSHDCRRDHAIREDEGNWDSKGRKERPVERDRPAPPYLGEKQDKSQPPYEHHYDKRRPGRDREDDGQPPVGGVRDTGTPVHNNRHDNDRQDNDRQRDDGRWRQQSPDVNTGTRPDNHRYRPSPPDNQQRDYGAPGRNQSREQREAGDGARQDQRGSRNRNSDASDGGSSHNSGKRSRQNRGNDAASTEASPDGQ